MIGLVAIVAGFLLSGIYLGSRVEAQSNSSAITPTPTPTPASSPAKPTPTPTPFDDPNEVIKVDTELVNLNVRVVDRNNRPINNIQQKEFKIYEDNNLQVIDFFSRSEVPTNYALVIDNSGSLLSLFNSPGPPHHKRSSMPVCC